MAIDFRTLVYHSPRIPQIKLAKMAEDEKKRVQEDLLKKLEAMGLIWYYPAMDVPRSKKAQLANHRLYIGKRCFYVVPQKPGYNWVFANKIIPAENP